MKAPRILDVNPDPDEYALVTGDEEVPPVLVQALGAGLRVLRCPGPSEVHCPAVHGKPCPLRQRAKVAIVYLAGEHEYHRPGRWDCIAGGRSPALAVLEGRKDALRAKNGFAVVGSERGPVGVLQALACLFDSPD
jgi:hypothetical protein